MLISSILKEVIVLCVTKTCLKEPPERKGGSTALIIIQSHGIPFVKEIVIVSVGNER